MQKLVVILLWPVYFSLAAQNSEVWYLHCDSGKAASCAYLDANGQVKIPPGKYDTCYTPEFTALAFVKIHKKVVAINKAENILFEVYCENQQPDVPVEGIFRILENSKIGYANLQGKVLVPPQYDAATPFKQGMAFVNIGCNTALEPNQQFGNGGKWGAINRHGALVVPIRYSNLNVLDAANQEIKSPEIQ